MQFNTIHFFIFISCVFGVYYLLSAKFRWMLLLAASIFFYMFGNPGTIITPVIIIAATFFLGMLIENTADEKIRKRYFLMGVVVNVGLLVFFKYTNFFICNIIGGLNFTGHFFSPQKAVKYSFVPFNIIVPLGISYITFSAIGYLIEIHRGDEKAEKHFGFLATWLLFFPKLIAGPIERAQNFLPQFREKKFFDYNVVVAGLKRFLWGLFLKLVIADRVSIYVDLVFGSVKEQGGITLLITAVLYVFQLYADFSGYTSMAIGAAQIFGFRLMENFNHPLTAKSVPEFWRKWHISLTTWVNDYIYDPVVFNYRRWKTWSVVFGCMVTFLILGFWHGANWTYIIFGFLQGFIVSVYFFTQKIRKKIRGSIPTWVNNLAGISFTFFYFCFSLIFFKAGSVGDAFAIIDRIKKLGGRIFAPEYLVYSVIGIGILIASETADVYFPEKKFLTKSENVVVRYFSYGLMIILILVLGVFDGGQFIYFKF